MNPDRASSAPRAPRSRRWLVAALQLAALGAVLAWGNLRLRTLEAQRALPPLRAEPLEIRPLRDHSAVVGDADLRRVLSRLGLHRRGPQTSIGHVDHSLRLWGPAARFDDAQLMSGEEMRLLLTNDRSFIKVYGRQRAPLLIDAGEGIRVRTFEGEASSTHVDHTLASLAEVGTPLSFPVFTRQRAATLRAVLEQSLRDFSLNQPETEWSALTYGLFLPTAGRWTTSEGQEITFDRLAARLMREPLPNGVCFGNHRLHGLVVFLRIDDLLAAAGEPRLLRPEARRRVIGFLRETTATLVRHQHADGFWNGDWPSAAPAASQPSDRDRLSDRIIVTGHVMEWWSQAPEELLPPPPVLASAARWLVRTVDGLSREEIQAYTTYLSHAGHALALWRGRELAATDRGP